MPLKCYTSKFNFPWPLRSAELTSLLENHMHCCLISPLRICYAIFFFSNLQSVNLCTATVRSEHSGTSVPVCDKNTETILHTDQSIGIVALCFSSDTNLHEFRRFQHKKILLHSWLIGLNYVFLIDETSTKCKENDNAFLLPLFF